MTKQKTKKQIEMELVGKLVKAGVKISKGTDKVPPTIHLNKTKSHVGLSKLGAIDRLRVFHNYRLIPKSEKSVKSSIKVY